MEDKDLGQGGVPQKALIHLNPETLRALLEDKKKKKVGNSLPLKAFKLSFTKSSPSIMGFGEFGRAVLEVIAMAEEGLVEEMIVGDLAGASKLSGHQTKLLRQIFVACPNLKKCVDLDGNTIPAFLKYKEQCQTDNNKGRIDFFPEEVKMMTLKNLEMKDLATCRLVDKAWSNTATSLFEKEAIVDVFKVFVDSPRNRREKKKKEGEEESSMGFRHFKIIKDPSYDWIPFREFAAKVLAGLKDKVKGGGKDVEGLTISDLGGTAKEEWTFLASLFTICHNVKEVKFEADFRELPGDPLQEGLLKLPVLDHVRTLVWGCCWVPSSLIAPVTPQVEALVDTSDRTLSSLKKGYWPHLKSLQGVCLLNTVPPIRPLVKISLSVHGALKLSHVLRIMEDYSRVLEVLRLEERSNCFYFSFSPGPRYQGWGPFPVMPKLRTLSLLNADPRQLDVEGFIFGDKLKPANVQNPMRLETHFPALTTFEFTVATRWNHYHCSTNLATCINFLNFFPLLLLEDDLDQGPTFPSVRTLTLNWMDPEEDFEYWKVWTRRVVAKFPNVKGNPHVDKWNGLEDAVKEDKSEEDRVLAEWKMLEGRV